MTTLEEDLKTLLNTVTLYPDSVPTDATFPCATYQMISSRQFRTHAGNSLRRPRMQIVAWGKTKSSASATANTIKSALDLNHTAFELATIEDEGTGKEVESGLYSVRLDFYIWSNK